MRLGFRKDIASDSVRSPSLRYSVMFPVVSQTNYGVYRGTVCAVLLLKIVPRGTMLTVVVRLVKRSPPQCLARPQSKTMTGQCMIIDGCECPSRACVVGKLGESQGCASRRCSFHIYTIQGVAIPSMILHVWEWGTKSRRVVYLKPLRTNAETAS